jgi:hypothetical protein
MALHYVRKPHLRCAHTKNRDVQTARLSRHVLHYRVIRDACPSASPISIHWKHVKLMRISHYKTHLRGALRVRVSHYKTHLRGALRVRVTNLIAGWAPVALLRDAPRVVRLPLLRNLRHTLY